MIVIGLVLVLAGAGFGIDLVFKNGHRITGVEVFGTSVGIHSVATVFILGGIVGAAILLGVALLIAGTGRKGSRALSHHREHRELHNTQQTAESLQAENSELRSRLEQQDREVRDQQDRARVDERSHVSMVSTPRAETAE